MGNDKAVIPVDVVSAIYRELGSISATQEAILEKLGDQKGTDEKIETRVTVLERKANIAAGVIGLIMVVGGWLGFNVDISA